MKIYQLLFSHKDKTNNVSKPGVYLIPCECGEVYISETGQNLTTREKEHLGGCRKGQSNQEIFGSQTCLGERPQIPIERL